MAEGTGDMNPLPAAADLQPEESQRPPGQSDCPVAEQFTAECAERAKRGMFKSGSATPATSVVNSPAQGTSRASGTFSCGAEDQMEAIYDEYLNLILAGSAKAIETPSQFLLRHGVEDAELRRHLETIFQ